METNGNGHSWRSLYYLVTRWPYRRTNNPDKQFHDSPTPYLSVVLTIGIDSCTICQLFFSISILYDRTIGARTVTSCHFVACQLGSEYFRLVSCTSRFEWMTVQRACFHFRQIEQLSCQKCIKGDSAPYNISCQVLEVGYRGGPGSRCSRFKAGCRRLSVAWCGAP